MLVDISLDRLQPVSSFSQSRSHSAGNPLCTLHVPLQWILHFGTIPHISGIIIGRLFSGFLSAIPSIIVAGSFEDKYDAELRVWADICLGCICQCGLNHWTNIRHVYNG